MQRRSLLLGGLATGTLALAGCASGTRTPSSPNYAIAIADLRVARTILDLARSTSTVTHAPPRAGDIRRSVTTMDKAERLLAFHPKVGLREGLDQTLAWVRTQTNT